MEIQINSRNVPLTEAQTVYVQRRLQFALGRFVTQVRVVEVTMNDVNGPKGGKDIQCSLKVILSKKGEILASDTDASVEVAVAHAAGRAARSVARLLARQSDHQGLSMSVLKDADGIANGE